MHVVIRLSLLLVVSLLVCVCVAQHDETVSPGAKGSGVVEAVCSRLESSCAFPEDRLFTRRLAYVESYDGTHPKTYREGYHGGIWQVDKVMFDLTQSTEARSTLLPTIQKIRLAFGIDWLTIQWAYLRKPLYSAIGARLYIQYTARTVPQIPRSIEDQANYWVRYYRVEENAERFSREASKLETMCSNTIGADIVFILDESTSVGSANFLKVKSFVKDIVRSFNVGLGTNQSRIAVMTYSRLVHRKFVLNQYTTQQAVLNAVDRIAYNGGGTSTDLALDELSQRSFLVANGGRPKEAGHPRVGIVVTDGKSDIPSRTISSAKRVHDGNITVFAVGVGSSVYLGELEAIASKPTCLHLMLLSNFEELDSIKDIIQKRTCDVNDECKYVTCYNDGKCVQQMSSAWCECTSNFTGPNCETAIDFCEPNPCTNGRCIPGVGQFTCECNPGYTGATCQTDIDECMSSPCDNGTCQDGVAGFTCQCYPGYTGPTCGDVIDLCESNPCLNGATCTAVGSRFCCTCAPGFTGTTCETEKNECLYDPCKNGGTCTDKLNGYVCTCAPGFTGSNCLTEKIECSPNPCANGGTCTDKVNGYVCTCLPGFTGSNCLTATTTPSPGGEKYDCSTNNPCLIQDNINNGRLYFAHVDPTKFVQCGAHGQCYIMSCSAGTVWNQAANTCMAAAGDYGK